MPLAKSKPRPPRLEPAERFFLWPFCAGARCKSTAVVAYAFWIADRAHGGRLEAKQRCHPKLCRRHRRSWQLKTLLLRIGASRRLFEPPFLFQRVEHCLETAIGGSRKIIQARKRGKNTVPADSEKERRRENCGRVEGKRHWLAETAVLDFFFLPTSTLPATLPTRGRAVACLPFVLLLSSVIILHLFLSLSLSCTLFLSLDVEKQ